MHFNSKEKLTTPPPPPPVSKHTQDPDELELLRIFDVYQKSTKAYCLYNTEYITPLNKLPADRTEDDMRMIEQAKHPYL